MHRRTFVEGLAQDIRLAARTLWRRPGRTGLAAVTLGLGVGASLVMVVLVRDILLRPLDFPQPDRLVRLIEVSDEGGRYWPSWPNIADWRDHARPFSGVAATTPPEDRPVVLGESATRVPVAALSRDALAVLGVEPVVGRGFRPEENAAGGPPVALVSWRFWRTELGGASIESLSLGIGRERYSVVGVLPEGFRFLSRSGAWGDAAVWTPLERSTELGGRSSHGYHVVARLADGVTHEGAASAMNALADRLAGEHGEATHADRVAVTPLLDDVVGRARQPLRFLTLAALGVLLVACMNLAAGLLAEGFNRGRELDIRMALGAQRSRVARQLVVEALLLAIPGLMAGAVVAAGGLELLRALGTASLPRLDAIGLDLSDLATAGVLALVAAGTAGVLPALRSSRASAASLRVRGSSVRGGWLWNGFVAGQMALTVVLVIGCGLLMRSFVAAVTADVGYDADQVLAVDVALPESSYESPDARIAFYESALDRLRALPAVTAAGITNVLTHETSWPSRPMGRANAVNGDADRIWSAIRRVDDSYFDVVRIPRVGGATLPAAGPDEPGILIDRRLAEGLWEGQSPMGERLDWGGPVAGIVGSVREWDQDVGRGTVYMDYRARPDQILSMHLLVRHSGPVGPVARAVRRTMADLDPVVPVDIAPLTARARSGLAGRRLLLVIAAVFAALTLALAATGVHALVAFVVGRRRHEAAIRMAIGARPDQISRHLARYGAIPALAGVALGLVAALPMASALRTQLFRVDSFDPLVFATTAAALALAAAAAAWLPARRAGRVQVSAVLRQD